MRVFAVDPLQIGLPRVRTLVVVEKKISTKNSQPQGDRATSSSAPQITPEAVGEGAAAVANPPQILGKTEQRPQTTETVSYYVSSHLPRRAEFFAELIRGHWGGCEIRNHWVRDALFEEDATRSKNVNLNGNLAVLRGALIALKARLAPDKSWTFLRELSAMKVSLPYNMICKNLFK